MADLVGAEYPIVSDPGGEVARQYGVFNLLGDGVATPSTFIVGKDGRIAWQYVGQDIADRPSSEALLLRVREAVATS